MQHGRIYRVKGEGKRRKKKERKKGRRGYEKKKKKRKKGRKGRAVLTMKRFPWCFTEGDGASNFNNWI